MFNCPKCGADNLLTAIFCRCCGERLELSAIKPEELAEKPKKTGSEKANEIVGIILLVVIVLGLLGALCPVPGHNGSAEVAGSVDEKYEKLAKKYKNDVQVSFTGEEAACLATRAVSNFSGDTGLLKPSSVGVKFLGDGNIRLTLTQKLSFLPVSNVINVTPQIPGQGSMNFKVNSCRLGYIPLPESLWKFFLDKFANVARSSLGNVRDYKFLGASVTDDNITFVVRAH